MRKDEHKLLLLLFLFGSERDRERGVKSAVPSRNTRKVLIFPLPPVPKGNRMRESGERKGGGRTEAGEGGLAQFLSLSDAPACVAPSTL